MRAIFISAVAPRFSKLFFGLVLLSLLLISPVSHALILPPIPATECPAVLSGDLSLTVPVLEVNGQAFSVDFRVVPGQGAMELTGFAPTDPGAYLNCKPSLVSQGLELHIPTLLFNGSAYVADFEYAHDLLWVLTGAGNKTNTNVYDLMPGSTFQQGCLPPCMCPISIELPMTGTFSLIEINPDRFMENRYSLDDIKWAVMDSNGQVMHTITGFGVYRIGGDFALMQQLVLDLSIDNGPMIRLDSGMQIPKYTFPGISIPLATGTQCFNTLLNINAAPVY